MPISHTKRCRHHISLLSLQICSCECNILINKFRICFYGFRFSVMIPSQFCKHHQLLIGLLSAYSKKSLHVCSSTLPLMSSADAPVATPVKALAKKAAKKAKGPKKAPAHPAVCVNSNHPNLIVFIHLCTPHCICSLCTVH